MINTIVKMPVKVSTELESQRNISLQNLEISTRNLLFFKYFVIFIIYLVVSIFIIIEIKKQ
jgi:hypothetical protein